MQNGNNGNSNPGTSVAATYTLTPTAGNLLIAVVGNTIASTAPTTPAGWSVAISETNNAPGQVIFYKIAGASEPTTVTVSGYGTSTALGLHIYEFSGVATTSPLDQTASSTGSGTAVASGTTAVTNQADELLLAGVVLDSKQTTYDLWSNTFTEIGDFSLGNPNKSTFGAAYRIVSATGAYSTTATAAQSGTWRGQIATFKAASTCPGGVVTTTADTGTGSLRECINFANANPGTTISFNIATAPNQSSGADSWWRISATSVLPTVTANGTTIDGSTQAVNYGSNTNTKGPEIEINVGTAGSVHGLTLTSDNNVIHELVINGFNHGIHIDGGLNNTITGNYIGTNATGASAIANTQGIWVQGVSTGTTIGTSAAGDRNIISGNSFVGILDSTSGGLIIKNNYIGTDRTGTVAIPNTATSAAVLLQANGNTVGGSGANEGNLISGNTNANTKGISVISDNNVIQGNRIGTQADGVSDLGNGNHGIWIHLSSSSNTIGGTGAGEANTIAFNGGDGVYIEDALSVGNAISGNAIFENTGLGIDLDPDGVGVGTGANNDQAAPIVYGMTPSGADFVVTASVTSGDTIEFFRVDNAAAPAVTADGTGSGEAYLFLGSCVDNGGACTGSHISGSDTDATLGVVTVTLTSSGLSAGNVVTATTTDATNGTSEFGPNMTAPAGATCQVSTTADSGGGSLRECINYANSNAGTTINFGIGSCTGASPCVISPTSALPTITGAGSVIDGYSETNAVANTKNFTDTPITDAVLVMELNGASAGGVNGLTIGADSVTIKGLSVYGFSIGILLSTGGTNATIVGNYIGVKADGVDATAGNGFGINGFAAATGATIGTNATADRNVISGNTSHGLFLSGSSGATVKNNFIGSDETGTLDKGNGGAGIFLTGGSNTVGGTAANDANLVSGNNANGIVLSTSGSTSNTFYGNYIGVQEDGTSALGNTGDGIRIQSSAFSNIIGGTSGNQGNTIAFNTGDGIDVSGAATDDNLLSANSIFENTGLGINLDGAGANNDQAAPTITTVTPNGSDFDVTVTLTASDTVEYFRVNNAAAPVVTADGSGAGEGFLYLGACIDNGSACSGPHISGTDTTSGDGTITVTLLSTGLSGGDEVTATTTDATNGTSEFSTNYTAPAGATTTIGDGTAPANKTVDPNDTNQAVSAFTLVTDSGTDTLSDLTVTRTGGADADVATNGVKIWDDSTGSTPNEWDAGDTQIGTGQSLSGGTASFSGLSVNITTSAKQYLITYDIASGATASNTLQAAVTAATVTTNEPETNNDNVDATLTVSSGAGAAYVQQTGTATKDLGFPYTDTVLTVSNAPTVGNTIVVSTGVNVSSSSSAPTCTDDAGNTYSIDANLSTFPSAPYRQVIVCSAEIGSGQVPTTITVTHDNANESAMDVHEFSGIAPAPRVDKTSTNSGSSTTPTSNTTGASTESDVLLFGALEVNGPSGDSFTADSADFSGGGGPFRTSITTVTLNTQYKITSGAAGTYAYAPTLGTSRAWTDAIVTYKTGGGGGATISGTVYTNEGTTTIVDGTTVRLLVNGANVGTDTTTGGAYSITAASLSANDTILVYVDNDDGAINDGTTVTVSDGNALTNLDIYVDHLITRHDNSGALSNAQMKSAVEPYVDTEILYSVDVSNNLTALGTVTELYVPTGHSYTPGANVDTVSIKIVGAVTAGGNTFNVSGDWSNSGTFAANTSSVILDGGNQVISGETTFNNLTKNDSNNDATDLTLSFENTKTQTVNGLLTLTGIDSDDRVNLVSDTGGQQWRINLAASATKNIDYIDVSDSDASGSDASKKPVSPTNSISSGNNIDWFPSTTISGTVYTDEGVTTVPDGTTVRLIVNGIDVGTDTTTAGAYSFSSDDVSTGAAILVYIDNDATYVGNTVTVSDGNNLAGLDIYAGRVIVRHDNSGALTATDMDNALGVISDADVLYDPGGKLVINNDVELFIPSGHTFAPGRDVDTQGSAGHVDIRGTLEFRLGSSVTISGDVDITATGRLTSSGISTGVFYIGGNWSDDLGTANIIGPNLNIEYQFTGAAKTISTNESFYSVRVSSTGSLTMVDNIIIANSIRVDNGATFTQGPNTMIINGSTFLMSGTYNHTCASTLEINGSLSLEQTTTYPNIVIKSGGSVTGANPGTIDCDVTIESGATFNTGALLYVGGNWTNNGGTLNTTGTVVFTGAGKTIGGTTATDFDSLTIGDSAGDSVTALHDISISGDLTVTADASFTVTAGKNLTSVGDTTINGDMYLSGTTTWAISNTMTVQVVTGGLLSIKGTDAANRVTVTQNGAGFYHMLIDGGMDFFNVNLYYLQSAEKASTGLKLRTPPGELMNFDNVAINFTEDVNGAVMLGYDTARTLNATGITFDSSTYTSTSDFNVEANSGTIEFGNYGGNYAGEADDFDNGGFANWLSGNNPPVGGYIFSDVIPAAQISQSNDGLGIITINWKARDNQVDNVTLHTFQYSDDGGATWYTPSNGDISGALSANWDDNGSSWSTATTFTGAAAHSFTFDTKHADVTAVKSLDGVDQSDVQIRFTVNDGTVDSVNPATSENFRVDNLAPNNTIVSAIYTAEYDTLIISGSNFTTLATAGTDIKSQVDWSKFVWDINGDNGVTANITFVVGDISSLTVTDDTTLTLVFTGAKASAIEGTAGYGAAGGDDTMDVTAGFSIDDNGYVATTDAVSDGPIVINTLPVGGYTADDVIPAAQVTQATDGSGNMTINWKARDDQAHGVTLHSFQYSDDGGATWNTLTNGDASGALSANWADNGSSWTTATTFAAATAHSFTFDTKHADITVAPGLDGRDQSDVRIRFYVKDSYDSVNPVTSENFRVDNKTPTNTIVSGQYNSSTDTLVITGTNFTNIANTGADIKTYVDWTKIVWDINGDDATTANITFVVGDVTSLTVTDATTLTLVFTAAKGTAIEATAGYGATGGADTLDVTAGFSIDVFGNVATTDAVVNGPITIFSGVTVSGTVYTDEGATTIADGTTVRLLVNGVSAGTDTTTGGAYSLAGVSLAANDAILVYIDNNDGNVNDGTTVTVSDGNSLANLDIYVDHLIVRHDNAGSLGNALMKSAVEPYVDTEILYSVDASNNLTVSGTGTELYLPASHAYTPGANIVSPAFKSLGTFGGGAGTIDVNGILAISGGAFTATSGSMTVADDLLITGAATYTHSSGTVTLDTTTTADLNAGGQTFNVVNVQKATGTVTLTGNLNATGNVTLTDSTLDLAGFNLTNVNTLTVDGTSTLQLQGAETVTSTTLTLNSGSTVIYTGDGDTLADSYTLTTLASTYHHLTVNSTDGATDTFNLGAALDVNGNFTNTAGTVDVTVTNYQINVGGNWSNSGTFTPQGGTVVLDGANQGISGSTTFKNLTKTDSVNDTADLTLTFDNLATQTVSGLLTLTGLDANDRINLVSDSPGNRWGITLTSSATKSINWVDVTDSDASGSDVTKIPVNPTNSIDNGNNLDWFTYFTVDGDPADWTDGDGTEYCINDQGGADDWTSPDDLDITKFCVASNRADTFYLLFGYDDTAFNNTSVSCIVVDTDDPANGFVDRALCVTLDNDPSSVVTVELFTCNDTLTSGCDGATLSKTYTGADYGFTNTETGPFGNADSFLELEVPYADLGIGGGSADFISLISYPGTNFLKNPKDSIFGATEQNYVDRISYDADAGTGSTNGDPPSPSLSGVVYTDEGVTTMAAGKTIRLIVNGVDTANTTTDTNGAYIIETAVIAGDDILFYIDGDATYKGTVATVFDGTSRSDLDIYDSHVIVREDNGGTASNTTLNTALGAFSDTDIEYSVTGGNLTVSGTGTELYLPSGYSYTPGGNITTPAMESLGTFNGGANTLDVNGDLTLSGGSFTSTSATLTVAGDFIKGAGGFTHNSGTVTLDGTGAQNITSGGGAFNDFTINKSSGTATLQDALSIDNNLSVSAGELDTSTSNYAVTATNNITTAGTLTGNGSTITLGGNWDSSSGSFNYDTSSVVMTGVSKNITMAGVGERHFYDLTINAGASVTDQTGTVITAGGELIVSGTFTIPTGKSFSVLDPSSDLTINAGGVLTVIGSLWMYTSDSRVTHLTNDGTINGGGEFYWRLNAGAESTAAPVTATNYGNLRVTFSTHSVAGGGGTAVLGPAAATLTTTGALDVYDAYDGGLAIVLKNDTNNLTVNAGSLAVGNNGWGDGKLVAGSAIYNITGDVTTDNWTTPGEIDAGSSTWTVGGNWTNNDVFTAGASSVTFNGATSTTIDSGGDAFNNLFINKTDAADANDNVTVITNDLTVNGTLTITDGELIQQRSITTGTVTLSDVSSKWTNVTDNAHVTLSGTVSNSGTITFDAPTGDLIQIRSSIGGTQRNWQGSGTFSMTDVDVQDQTCLGGTPPNIIVNSGTNSGNNINWIFGASIIGGTVYTDDDEATTLNNKAITVVVYDGSIQTAYTTTTNGSGVYSVTNGTLSSGDIILVYLNNEPEEGLTVLESDGANIADLNVYQNHVGVRSQVGAVSNVDMDNVDDGDDDVKYSVAGGNITIDSGFELFVFGPSATSTFTPGGNVTTQGTGGNFEFHGLVNAETYTFTIGDDWIRLTGATGGLINVGTSTVIMDPTDGSATIDNAAQYGDYRFHNLVIAANKSVTSIGTGYYISGDMTLQVNSVYTKNSTFIGLEGDLLMDATSTFNVNGGTFWYYIDDSSPDIERNNTITGSGVFAFYAKPGSTAAPVTVRTYGCILEINGQAGDVAALSDPDALGTLNLGSYDLRIYESSGNEWSGATLDNPNNINITTTGDLIIGTTFSGRAGKFVPRDGTMTFANVLIEDPHDSGSNIIDAATGAGSGSTWNISGNVTINGAGSQLGTLTAGPSSWNVGGDWTNSGGTFTAGTSTITFNGTGQAINGSTTFYNLNKTVVAADTLTFQSGQTTTIAAGGTVTLQGGSGNILNLRSSTPGTQWDLTVNGSSDVLYVDVDDSNALAGNTIYAYYSTDDTGPSNNDNWVFEQLQLVKQVWNAAGDTCLASSPSDGGCNGGVSSVTLPTGSTVYFLIFVRNPLSITASDVRMQDLIDDTGFNYVTNSIERTLNDGSAGQPDDNATIAAIFAAATNAETDAFDAELGAERYSGINTGASPDDLRSGGDGTAGNNDIVNIPPNKTFAIRFRATKN